MTHDATAAPEKCHECGAKLDVPEQGCPYCGHGRKAPPAAPAAAPATPAEGAQTDEASELAKSIESAATSAFDKIKSFVTGQPAAAAAATAAAAAPVAAAPAAAPAATAPTKPSAATATPAKPRPQTGEGKAVAGEGGKAPARAPLAPEQSKKVSSLKEDLRNGPAADVVSRATAALERQRARKAEEDEEDDETDEDLDQLYAMMGVVYYVCLADEELDDDEYDELLRVFSDLLDGEADEELLEGWIEEWDEAWEEDDSYDEMLEAFAESLEDAALKRQAFDLAVGVAALDGEISEEEHETVVYIADALGISERDARKALRKAVE